MRLAVATKATPAESPVEENKANPQGAPDGSKVSTQLPAYDGKTTHGVLTTNEGDTVHLTSGNADPRYANYPAASHVEGVAEHHVPGSRHLVVEVKDPDRHLGDQRVVDELGQRCSAVGIAVQAVRDQPRDLVKRERRKDDRARPCARFSNGRKHVELL